MTARPPSHRSGVRLRQAVPWVSLAAMLVLVASCSSGAAAPTASPVPIAATASPAQTVMVSTAPAPTLAPKPTVAIVMVTPIPGAPDSGIVVKLSVKLSRWSVGDIDAPAGQVWHVQIDNHDEPFIQHNFTAASGPSFAERIFQSPGFHGKYTFGYDIPALPAGRYLFICTLHADLMTGTLTIR